MGTATSMATRLISMVPANSGMAPNAPSAATWSARRAVCGLQWMPNRKSTGEMRAKKRRLSNSSDSTMPSVVRMATAEQITSTTIRNRSSALRARRSGRSVWNARIMPSAANSTAMAKVASRPWPIQAL